MSAPYDQLIEATIQHLQELKARGARFVVAAPATIAALTQPAARLSLSTPTADPAQSDRPGAMPRGAVDPSPALFPAAEPRPGPIPAGASANLPVSSAPPPASAAGASVDPGAKARAMQVLREQAMVCVKCSHLASSRQNVVFGVGDPNAALLFVGEAPGADEDQQGEPFVGAAGQLLTRIIQTMGLSRDTVYIANILKCRPDTPGQAYGNRKPTLEEMKTCIPYLHSQIDIIQPKVVVALGATAVEGLLGKTEGITRLRGRWQTYRGIPLMPTFHPSYLLRSQALSEKRKVWEDMLQVLEKLGRPVSEKQRVYFLNA